MFNDCRCRMKQLLAYLCVLIGLQILPWNSNLKVMKKSKEEETKLAE